MVPGTGGYHTAHAPGPVVYQYIPASGRYDIPGSPPGPRPVGYGSTRKQGRSAGDLGTLATEKREGQACLASQTKKPILKGKGRGGVGQEYSKIRLI